MEGLHQAASLGKHSMGCHQVLSITRLGGLRKLNLHFERQRTSQWQLLLGRLGRVFLEGSRGWEHLAPLILQPRRRGNDCRSIKAWELGAAASSAGCCGEAGQVPFVCCFGPFKYVFFHLSLLQPGVIWWRAGQLLAGSCWEELGGSVSLPRLRPRSEMFSR